MKITPRQMSLISQRRLLQSISIFCTFLSIMSSTQALETPLGQQVDLYRTHPKIRAFLDTIAFAEGTYNQDGYRTQYPKKLFTDFSDHPRTIRCAPFRGQELCASAAGRYQILSKIWDKIAPKIQATDFSPEQQDRAAIYLLIECKALTDILHNRLHSAIQKAGNVWATLPGSRHDQVTCTTTAIEKFYDQQLILYTGKQPKKRGRV